MFLGIIHLIRKQNFRCQYQGIRNVSFPENFTHVLNVWFLKYHLLSTNSDKNQYSYCVILFLSNTALFRLSYSKFWANKSFRCKFFLIHFQKEFLWIVYLIKKEYSTYFSSTVSFYMLPKIFYSFLKMSRFKIQVRFSRMVCISPMFEMVNNILKKLDATSRFMTGVF